VTGTTEKEYQTRGKASLPAIRKALQDYCNKLIGIKEPQQ